MCSDGFDRNKQKWLKQNCDKDNHHLQGNPNICSEIIHNTGIYNNPDSNLDDFTNHIHDTHQEYDHNDQKPFTDSKSSEYIFINLSINQNSKKIPNNYELFGYTIAKELSLHHFEKFCIGDQNGTDTVLTFTIRHPFN